jgi:hypothetical protein
MEKINVLISIRIDLRDKVDASVRESLVPGISSRSGFIEYVLTEVFKDQAKFPPEKLVNPLTTPEET